MTDVDTSAWLDKNGARSSQRTAAPRPRPVDSDQRVPDERGRVLTGRSFDRVRRLLETNGADATALASDLALWLQDQTADVREAALRELSPALEKVSDELTRLTAIELVARWGPEFATRHILTYLDSRPIRDSHLYPLAFARLEGVADPQGCLISSVTELLLALPAATLPEETSAELATEAFFTLAQLAPNCLLRNAAETVARIHGFQQTRLLDAIAMACRKSRTPSVTSNFSEVILKKWSEIVSTAGVVVDDRPGVAAILLEIIGRCHLGFRGALNKLNDTEIEYRILYQLVQRPLDFLESSEQAALTRRTVKLLAEHRQARTLSKVIGLPETGDALLRDLMQVIAKTL